MNLKYHIVREEQLGPFIHDLRSIEKNIEYPLEDGTEGFYIDHGNDYSPFFTQQGYKTRFLIIINKEVLLSWYTIWHISVFFPIILFDIFGIYPTIMSLKK